MSGKFKSKHFKLLWCIVPLIVVVELLLQWRIPYAEPSEKEWEAAASYISKQKQEGDLVVFAPAWAVQSRMYIGDLISLRDFGHFDTDRYSGIVELSVGGRRASETEGLDAVSEHDFGRITVRRYQNTSRPNIIYDFVDHYSEMKMTGAGGRSPRLFIDHWFNPRYILPLDLKPSAVTATFKNVPLAGVIHINTMIAYREARFNVGTPVDLTVYVNGKVVGRRTVDNFDLIEPVDFPVNLEGTGTVQFEVKTRNSKKRRFGFVADVRSPGEVSK